MSWWRDGLCPWQGLWTTQPQRFYRCERFRGCFFAAKCWWLRPVLSLVWHKGLYWAILSFMALLSTVLLVSFKDFKVLSCWKSDILRKKKKTPCFVFFQPGWVTFRAPCLPWGWGEEVLSRVVFMGVCGAFKEALNFTVFTKLCLKVLCWSLLSSSKIGRRWDWSFQRLLRVFCADLQAGMLCSRLDNDGRQRRIFEAKVKAHLHETFVWEFEDVSWSGMHSLLVNILPKDVQYTY